MFSPAGHVSVLDAILLEVKKLHSSNLFLQSELASLKRSIAIRSSFVGNTAELPADAPGVCVKTGEGADASEFVVQPGTRWVCPICDAVLKHKESFKGHIRKLLSASGRSRCHLNPLDVDHRIMVHRFPGVDIQDQIAAFSREFYSQVCVSCTQRDDDDLSHAHVFAWIAAAKSNVTQGNVVPFPVFDPACSSATTRKHRRTECGSAQRSDCSSLQSSQSSFISSASSSFSPRGSSFS
jgi:hypothetical protein